MRTFTRVLVVLVGLAVSAMWAGPAFAEDPAGVGPTHGYIEICKKAEPGISGHFKFRVDTGAVSTDWADHGLVVVNAGECSPPLWVMLDPSHQVTVSEVDGYTDNAGVMADSFDWHMHFTSSEYSEVTAIHTLAPLGIDGALVGTPDLANRSAVVTVNPVWDGDKSKETIVEFTNDPVNGYFEICKLQNTGAGLDGQVFRYDVFGAMGFQTTVSVPVGSCTTPIYAPAGHVNIHELDDAFVTDISAVPDGALMHSWDAWAQLKVVPAALGFTENESVVTFTDDSSQLKICKATKDPELYGMPFSFAVNGAPYSVTAGFDGGHCVLTGRYRTGTVMTVMENPTVGVMLAKTDIDPWFYGGKDDLVMSGNDLTGNIATFELRQGVTTLTFYNAVADPGSLKICKLGTGTGSVTYTIAGPRFAVDAKSHLPKVRDVDDIANGSSTVSVPYGSCSLVMPNLPYAGIQTITETIPAGTAISSIVVDSGLQAVAPNLAAGTVGAFISAGTTVVTYTNGAAVVAPVVTPVAGGSGGGGGSDSTPPAAAPVSTPPVSSAVTAPVTKTTAAMARLSSAKIMTLKAGRYVVVKVLSPKATAKIHVRLLSKSGMVMKNAVRTVKTNALVRVPNLKVAKNIAKVRVNVIS